MLLSNHTVAVTDVNTLTTLTRPCSTVLVKNDGTDTLYVNVKTGIAAVTGVANMPLLGGEGITFKSNSNDIVYVGLICAAAETTNARIVGSANE